MASIPSFVLTSTSPIFALVEGRKTSPRSRARTSSKLRHSVILSVAHRFARESVCVVDRPYLSKFPFVITQFQTSLLIHLERAERNPIRS